ncbi:MAG: DUF4870 domain-containing protein [Capnocytophaga sp.]|nr:DUF4870 domain-containing protein [Capnocytophaga sp.]
MNGKIQSVLSYLGLLFWLIAYFGGKEQRNDLSRYHLKQGLGFFIVCVAFNVIYVIVAMISSTLAMIVGAAGLILFILMIFGIINAANEVKKPLPLIGKMFEDKFDFIDK